MWVSALSKIATLLAIISFGGVSFRRGVGLVIVPSGLAPGVI